MFLKVKCILDDMYITFDRACFYILANICG